MVTYYLKKNTLASDSVDYHAVITQQESTDGDAYVKQSAETLNISEGQVIGILRGLAASAVTLIKQGRGFKLPGFCSFSFGIHGAFNGPDAPWEDAVQKMVVNIHADRTLTAAAQEAPKTRIHGVIYGPVIDALVDLSVNTTNSTLHPGRNIKLIGKNIKIAGTEDTIGIRFIDAGNNTTHVAAMDIALNSPTELLFICPALSVGVYHVEVWTQYTRGTYFIDDPRMYRLDQELTVA
ncbi:DUF4469 domain-containing protein [Breznakiellaceae bacterium SP9]